MQFRAPPLPLAALLSPVLWRLNQPDRFDCYSVGIIMMQLAFPPLRTDSTLVAFNVRLSELDYDLDAWKEWVNRKSASQFAEGFQVLDADGGKGWQLVKNVCPFRCSPYIWMPLLYTSSLRVPKRCDAFCC